MKQLFFLLTALIVFTQADAQFTLDHDSVIVIDVHTNGDVVGHNNITNTSGAQVNYTWRRMVNTLATGWNSAICDPDLCYLHTVSTENFTLAAAQTDILDVHVYAGGNLGTGYVKVCVWETTDSAGTVQCAEYFIEVEQDTTNTGIFSQTLDTEISIFPNPAQTVLNIELTSNHSANLVEVFTLSGELVISETIENLNRISLDVSELHFGSYILKAGNGSETVARTFTIGK